MSVFARSWPRRAAELQVVVLQGWSFYRARPGRELLEGHCSAALSVDRRCRAIQGR